MKRRLVLRKIARHELDEAIGWYEEQRRGLGQQLRAEVDDAFSAIQAHPELYRKVCGDARRVVLRRFPYLIYYLVEPDPRRVSCETGSRRIASPLVTYYLEACRFRFARSKSRRIVLFAACRSSIRAEIRMGSQKSLFLQRASEVMAALHRRRQFPRKPRVR